MKIGSDSVVGVIVTYQVPNVVPRVRFPGGAFCSHISITMGLFVSHQQQIICLGGAMDSASDFESEGCGFDPHPRCFVFFGRHHEDDFGQTQLHANDSPRTYLSR